MDGHTDVPSMPNITITQSGIYKLLTTLNEHKASGLNRSYISLHLKTLCR